MCLRENLEQQAGLAAFCRPVQKDAAHLQRLHILAVAGEAFGEHVVIGRGRRGHEGDAELLQAIPAGGQIIADQRDMLDALAVEGAQEFLDLALSALAFLIQGNADLAVGCGQSLRCETGIFALDVEEADLAEVEQGFVIVGPILHPARVNVVGEVIDGVEACARRIGINAGQVVEVDVVDRQIVALAGPIVAIDQIEDRPANAADRRDAQFHRAGFIGDRLCALGDEVSVSLGRIAHAKRHAAGRWAMLAGKIPRGRARFVIGDEVDAALPPQVHVLGTMLRDAGEAHRFEHRFEDALFRRAELDEFEAVEAGGVFEQVLALSVHGGGVLQLDDSFR